MNETLIKCCKVNVEMSRTLNITTGGFVFPALHLPTNNVLNSKPRVCLAHCNYAVSLGPRRLCRCVFLRLHERQWRKMGSVLNTVHLHSVHRHSDDHLNSLRQDVILSRTLESATVTCVNSCAFLVTVRLNNS